MSSETLNIVLAVILLLVVIYIVVRIALRARKYGGANNNNVSFYL